MNAFARVGTDHKPYDHPERVRAREERAVRERMMRACIAFNDLMADEQHAFADHLATIMPACVPVPPLTTHAAEAADWADWACTGELRAYFKAIWERMPADRQARFLAWASRRAA